MPGGEMLECVECGTSLHRSADLCSSCGIATPFGNECAICRRRSRKNELVEVDCDTDYGPQKSHYHLRCLIDHYLPMVCSACGLSFDELTAKEAIGRISYSTLMPGRCARCRAANPLNLLSVCYVCRGFVNRASWVPGGSKRSYHGGCEADRPRNMLGCVSILWTWLPWFS